MSSSRIGLITLLLVLSGCASVQYENACRELGYFTMEQWRKAEEPPTNWQSLVELAERDKHERYQHSAQYRDMWFISEKGDLALCQTERHGQKCFSGSVWVFESPEDSPRIARSEGQVCLQH